MLCNILNILIYKLRKKENENLCLSDFILSEDKNYPEWNKNNDPFVY